MGQKRVRDSKAQVPQSKKRKATKTEADSDDSAWDGLVDIDELNWQEVALPDRLEDAGGFLGLEEIDGVDIVRQQGNGQVQFKVGWHLQHLRHSS